MKSVKEVGAAGVPGLVATAGSAWLPAWLAFVKAVDTGSMAAAARLLGCTRAQVSRQIADVEAAFGARLLERSTRRLRLTPAGEIFQHHALAALEAVTATQIAVRNQGETPLGVLRVSATIAFGRVYVAPLLHKVVAQHPGLTGELILSDQLVDLEAQDIDLALRMTRVPPQDAVVRRLTTVQRVVCASPGYLAAHGTPVHPSELTQHQTLSYLMTDDHRWHLADPTGEEFVHTATSRLRFNSVECLVDAALAGLGIAIVPMYLANPLVRAGRLVAVLPEFVSHTQFGSHLYACYTPSRVRIAKVRVMLQALTELLEPVPPWMR
ncbi:MAG: LysR family transcriptional regulator [Ottowia sp.]|nr:LysR family transcriptional regulator [Ottowia sp.]